MQADEVQAECRQRHGTLACSGVAGERLGVTPGLRGAALHPSFQLFQSGLLCFFRYKTVFAEEMSYVATEKGELKQKG